MSKKGISQIFLEEKQKLDTDIKIKELEKEETKKIMRDIELKTEKKVVEITKIESTLQSILSDGAKEFKEKTGRNMTYSEMREMFG